MNRTLATELLARLSGRRLDLAQVLDRLRLADRFAPQSDQALFEISENARPTMSGVEIDQSIGPLLHYTTTEAAKQIREGGWLGLPGSGVWLTSTPYDGERASAELGLDRPCDVCLIVDVSGLGDQLLWGPAFADPSTAFPRVWPGGGLAFFYRNPIDLRHVVYQVRCRSLPAHELQEYT